MIVRKKSNFWTKEVGFFIHPIPVLALLTMFINDHFLKSQFHNTLTGKLSDVTGVFFFPLYLCALIVILKKSLGRSRVALQKRELVAAIAVTAMVFSSMNLFVGIADMYELLLVKIGLPSRITEDPTDLFCLVSLYFSYQFGNDFVNHQQGLTSCNDSIGNDENKSPCY